MRSLTGTVVLKVDPKRPDRKKLRYCANVLRKGGLVAFPTETVYGLGANLINRNAIKKLYKVKKRPKNKPFTVHITDLATIEKLGCEITRDARLLIDKFWPGPLTIILKSKDNKKIGFRMPANKVAACLIEMAGVPVVAPSANISGKTPPKSGRAVLKELNGRIDALIDSGRTAVGVESTVVDLTVKPMKLLRRGAIGERKILRVISNVKAQNPK